MAWLDILVKGGTPDPLPRTSLIRKLCRVVNGSEPNLCQCEAGKVLAHARSM